jgi:hypothetical protein
MAFEEEFSIEILDEDAARKITPRKPSNTSSRTPNQK